MNWFRAPLTLVAAGAVLLLGIGLGAGWGRGLRAAAQGGDPLSSATLMELPIRLTQSAQIRPTGQVKSFELTARATTWELLPGLTLSGEVQVMSSQFEAPGQPRNGGYTVVNAAAAYRLPFKRWGFLSNITLHVRATNLFNESYSEVAGFPALGTHVVAGIRATFD